MISALPWLLGGGMFLVYLLTLDRAVSPESLHSIARLDGITWLAELAAPVAYVVTYPIRWLHPAAIPFAINLFTAGCAALSLALLARCVILLPQDRTLAQRQRNADRHGFLNTGSAWLPPMLAVLACGLQLTFWEHAIAATGEMFDLLLFAVMVWCVLEYRASEKNSWLLWLALVNGLGVANDWAMVAFLPGFLIAVLWIKGFFNFFNPAYVARFLKEESTSFSLRVPLGTLGCWMAGALWFVLMPLLASRSVENRVAFWLSLDFAARNYQVMLTALPLRIIVLSGLSTLLPVLFMGIRWGRLVSAQPLAITVVRVLFNGVHAFFLGICLWSILGSPLSPRHLQPVFACLPLYFLAALSVGYYSGYFLLVFGSRTEKSHRSDRPPPPALNAVSVGAMCVLLVFAPSALVQRNLPEILRRKNDALAGYFDTLEKSLPAQGSVIFSADSSRVQYLETRLLRSGRQADYLLVDTGLLSRYPAYFSFLEKRNPQFEITDGFTNRVSEIANPAVLVNWVNTLSRSHGLYFMHPFAGVLGEMFFTQPRGMYFQLQPYATNAAYAEPPAKELMAENQVFWRGLEKEQFQGLARHTQPSTREPAHTLWQRFVQKAHLQPEPDHHALLAGSYYSAMIDAWAVTVQQTGALTEAGQWFDEARQLNPANNAAEVNAQCSRDLQAHKPLTVDTSLRTDEAFGRGRNWDESLRENGPIDEPSACFAFGTLCAEGGMYRQAIQQFTRAQTLAPESTNPPARLAEIFLRTRQYTNALAAAERLLQLTPGNPHALVLKGLALVELRQFYQAIPPLNDLLDLQPTNTDARLARAVSLLSLDKLAAAQEDYETVARALPTAYPAYFGLAEIAFRSKNAAAAQKNCELYLANAPAKAPEAAQIKTWLEKLKSPDPWDDAEAPSAKHQAP